MIVEVRRRVDIFEGGHELDRESDARLGVRTGTPSSGQKIDAYFFLFLHVIIDFRATSSY
jgi:hypothetical protein